MAPLRAVVFTADQLIIAGYSCLLILRVFMYICLGGIMNFRD